MAWNSVKMPWKWRRPRKIRVTTWSIEFSRSEPFLYIYALVQRPLQRNLENFGFRFVHQKHGCDKSPSGISIFARHSALARGLYFALTFASFQFPPILICIGTLLRKIKNSTNIYISTTKHIRCISFTVPARAINNYVYGATVSTCNFLFL